jgi:hypothetical protein
MKRFYPALVLMLLPGVMMSQSSSSPATKDPGERAPATQASQPSATTAPGTQPSATPAAPNTTQPSTGQTTTGTKASGTASDNDPLLDVPPLPKTKVTLVGGTVRNIDQIRNRMTVEPFGGGKMKFIFDERSHVYRDGVETTQLAIKKGDRVYVDSQLDGPKVFARNVRVVTQLTPADADGQLLAYDRRNGVLSMRDRLSSQPIRFRMTNDTKIVKENDQPGTQADLQSGALIGVEFAPDRANRGLAQKIKVLAVPGAQFRFAGKITHLDVKDSMMAIENASDGKNYEVAFNRADVNGRDDLAVGAEVNVIATFQGDKYLAHEMTVTQPASKEDAEKNKKDDKDKDKTSDNK